MNGEIINTMVNACCVLNSEDQVPCCETLNPQLTPPEMVKPYALTACLGYSSKALVPKEGNMFTHNSSQYRLHILVRRQYI